MTTLQSFTKEQIDVMREMCSRDIIYHSTGVALRTLFEENEALIAKVDELKRLMNRQYGFSFSESPVLIACLDKPKVENFSTKYNPQFLEFVGEK